jgi:hypothetical protein
MSFAYPYFNFPYSNNYSRYGYRYSNSMYKGNVKNAYANKDYSNNSVYKKEQQHSDFTNINLEDNKKEEASHFSETSPFLQFFGINLYFDDILIICILFFLYQEGVKDEGLFVVLILLLLS